MSLLIELEVTRDDFCGLPREGFRREDDNGDGIRCEQRCDFQLRV